MKRARKEILIAVLFVLMAVLARYSAFSGSLGSISDSCGGYGALDAKARMALASGYLEGVQEALDKETRAILVPPWYGDHPIWWVLPEGEVAAENLEASLTVFCRTKSNHHEKLSDAFRAIAARKAGAPQIAIPFADLPDSPAPADAWRKILSENSFACSDYRARSDAERARLVHGYFLGMNAMRTTLKASPAPSLLPWPAVSYQDIRRRLDDACQGDRVNAPVRELLWRAGMETATEKNIAEAR